MLSTFLVTVILAQTCFCDNNNWSNRPQQQQQQCSSQWQSHDQCMQSRQSDYRRTSDLSSTDRLDMKAKIRVCFRSQNCNDPFLSDAEAQAKQKCYLQYRDRFRADIQQCVQQKYSDYSLPAENDAAAQYGQDMISMRNSNCRPQNKQTFTNCLLQARGTKGQAKRGQSQRSDYCSVRYNCYQQTRYSQSCYDKSAQVRDELCRCTRQAQISAYKSLYVSCLRSAGYPVANEQQDYNLVALNSVSSGGGDKKFCSNATDPCGGFQGRQTVHRGSSQGGGRGWSGGQSWMGGSSSGSSGTSSSSSTSTAVDTSDLGTSLASSTDFGSLLSGGGVMPDPSSILSSATSTSALTGTGTGIGNLGSLLGGGFDPSQILGNSFDFQSLLSNAGTGGGLLSSLTSGTGSGLLSGSSLLSGGLPDLSSLLGGRKK